jgi:hypothetical protein
LYEIQHISPNFDAKVKEKTMAKKSVFWGMLALALTVSFTVVGCGDPLQEGGKVKIDYDKASAVDAVTAVLSTDKTFVIISWDAVEDVKAYDVFYQQKEKNTVLPDAGYPGSAQNAVIYKADGSASTANTDFDKWSAKLTIPATLQRGKDYRFGIQTSSVVSGVSQSDIVWSEYITVPAL